MKRVLVALLFALLVPGCDDDTGSTPEPEPDPEPEALSEPALVETRTFDADGELLFRDEYQHIDGRFHGFARRDAEGLTLAAAISAYGEDEQLGAIVFSDGPQRLFALEDFNYLDDARLQGFARRDAEGLTLDVHVVAYTTARTLQRVDVVDGPRLLYSDAYGYRDGAPARYYAPWFERRVESPPDGRGVRGRPYQPARRQHTRGPGTLCRIRLFDRYSGRTHVAGAQDDATVRGPGWLLGHREFKISRLI